MAKTLKRKTRTRAHVIADMSLHHLSYIAVSCTFTVEPVSRDYGYDLSIFTFDDTGQYENGNVFVQLKATDKVQFDRKTGEIIFRIYKRDISSWEGEPFPVYFVIFDAASERAYGLYLQKYLQDANISSAQMMKQSCQVKVKATALDSAALRHWRDDKRKVLARIGAVQHV